MAAGFVPGAGVVPEPAGPEVRGGPDGQGLGMGSFPLRGRAGPPGRRTRARATVPVDAVPPRRRVPRSPGSSIGVARPGARERAGASG
ncbi:hypothetical protein GCM10009759_36860 [Kitasatospora saccharophila]|uniref:Uncharacterized protein n=1 Tax=Kitasatospora saccharophila TaxID=407973 RepID=A0ABN2WZW0_9ACTN